MAQINISNELDERLPVMHYTVSLSDNPDEPYIDDYFTDYAGASSWPHTGISYKNVFLHVNHFNKDVRYKYQRVPVNDEHDQIITLKRAPLTQLKVNGLYFNLNHLRGNTDFMWWKKCLDGDGQLSDITMQRYKAGSKFIRTFGMTSAQSFGIDFKPQDYGNRYYDNIRVAAQLLELYGMYWYFNVFADTGLVMPGSAQQLDHYNRVVDELSRCTNIFMELVNEQGQHQNSVDRSAFKKPDSFIACSGSFGGRIPPEEPHWDFIDYHTRRDYPGCVMECNTADYNDNGKTRVSIGKPIGTGEPVKLGSHNPKPGEEVTNNRICHEVGFSGMGSSPFNVFHSQLGVRSELWDDITRENAEYFFGVK